MSRRGNRSLKFENLSLYSTTANALSALLADMNRIFRKGVNVIWVGVMFPKFMHSIMFVKKGNDIIYLDINGDRLMDHPAVPVAFKQILMSVKGMVSGDFLYPQYLWPSQHKKAVEWAANQSTDPSGQCGFYVQRMLDQLTALLNM